MPSSFESPDLKRMKLAHLESDDESEACGVKDILQQDLNLSDDSSVCEEEEEEEEDEILPKSRDFDRANKIGQESTIDHWNNLSTDIKQNVEAIQGWVKKLEEHSKRIDTWIRQSTKISETLTKINTAICQPFDKCTDVCASHCLNESKIVMSRGRQRREKPKK